MLDPVNAGVPDSSILGPILFLTHINELPDDITCNIAIYADNLLSTLKYDQGSHLCQKLGLASELESDLQDNRIGSNLIISMLAKLNWFRLNSHTGAIDGKMDGSVLEEK